MSRHVVIDPELKRAVEIIPEAIEEEFVRIPGDLALWGERYADALEQYLMAEMVAEETYARLLIEHRERLEAAEKKATEAAVKAAVDTDPKWHDVKLAMIHAEVDKVRADKRLRAVSAKKEAVISIGAHIRAEMEGDPSIREHSRGARDVRRSRAED